MATINEEEIIRELAREEEAQAHQAKAARARMEADVAVADLRKAIERERAGIVIQPDDDTGAAIIPGRNDKPGRIVAIPARNGKKGVSVDLKTAETLRRRWLAEGKLNGPQSEGQASKAEEAEE